MSNSTATPIAQPPAILEGGEYEHFMLRTPAEILVVLRGLVNHVSQITAFFNEGNEMLTTSLAVVADDHLILDFGPDSEINRMALLAEKHFCVTTLEKVRVQFILRGFTQVEQDGRPSFRCALPTEVLRLQRRENYRLLTPIARPLKCMVTFPLPNGSLHSHEAQVFDISGGGLGISTPAEGIPFEINTVLPDCHLELPEVGTIAGRIRIKSLFDISLRNGTRVRRAGCEFVRLPGPMMTLVQRYIIKVERERKAREMGMG